MKSKLRLRKMNENDQMMVKNWRMKPEITKYMYTDPVISEESQKIWFRSIEYDASVKYWIINYNDIDIGVLSITGIDNKNKRCDWAYYIADNSFKGKGLGRELECNVYDYVFFNLGLNKLCCEVMSNNIKVVEIHKHFGSSVEGERKEHIWKNNEVFDIIEMAILKSEWLIKRDSLKYNTIEIEE